MLKAISIAIMIVSIIGLCYLRFTNAELTEAQFLLTYWRELIGYSIILFFGGWISNDKL